uniref:Transposon MuDR mudrA n=1 Tax=Solanum tuberosum TaxID=4113 RepID=M1DTK5_SOLTU
MEHKKMIPKKEIDWYYSKEAALAVDKHKLQPVKGEPFWKRDPLHAIEPPELVKIVGRPKLMRERERIEDVKRQGVWKQTRKGKVMTCSNCGEQNHNARGCEKGKQPTKQGKETGREKKRQPRRGLVDEDEASEEDINCTANCTTPQPTQESQSEYAYSSIYFPVVEDDDEDPRLRPRTISEEAFLTRLRKRQNPQEPIESRVIGLRGDKFGISEPTNLPIAPTDLTWNGQGAVTTNQLQKLRPRKG